MASGRFDKQVAAMLAVVLSLLVSAPWASAVRWSPRNFPNPLHDVNSCGRHGKPSWICDPDHVLSEYNQNLVEGSIHEIAEGPYSTAHCSAGYQVVSPHLVLAGLLLSVASHSRVQSILVTLDMNIGGCGTCKRHVPAERQECGRASRVLCQILA